MMGFDHTAWQLQLDMLLAEANLFANQGMQLLLEQDLHAALDKAHDWRTVQDEITQHLDSRREHQEGKKP